MPTRTRIPAIALLVCLLMGSEVLATNGLYRIGIGPRSVGRGGADTALSDDAFAIHSNPAGMAFVPGHRYDGALGLNFLGVDFRSSINDDQSFEPIPAADFALVFAPGDPFHFGDAFDPSTYDSYYVDSDADLPDDPDLRAAVVAEEFNESQYGSAWRIGFGVIGITGGKIDLEVATEPIFTEPVDYETNTLFPGLVASVAYRPTNWLSIGASFDFVYALFEVDGPLSVTSETMMGVPTTIGGGTFGQLTANLLGNPTIESYSDMDDVRSYGFGGRIGVMVQPNRFISFGLVYQAPTYFLDMLGNVNTDFTREINFLTNDNNPLGFFSEAFLRTELPDFDQGFQSSYDIEIEFELPQQIRGGVAISPLDSITIALDVGWINWSSTMDEFSATLKNGTNPNVNVLLGSDQTSIAIPLDWDDQFVIGLGFSGNPTDWLTLRAGYNYSNNPIPADKMLPSFPVIIEHHITAGGSIYLGPWSGDFGFSWGLPNSVSIGQHDTHPELSNSTIEAELIEVWLGVGLSF